MRDNAQQSPETDTYAPGGIRTRNPSRRSATHQHILTLDRSATWIGRENKEFSKVKRLVHTEEPLCIKCFNSEKDERKKERINQLTLILTCVETLTVLRLVRWEWRENLQIRDDE
jgi:hypothetical protein